MRIKLIMGSHLVRNIKSRHALNICIIVGILVNKEMHRNKIINVLGNKY